MKKIIFVSIIIFLFLIALPASALTQSEIQALIQQIQQQIAQLQAQLQTLIGQQSGGQTWCHTFNFNLGYSNSGSAEVAYLHTALSKQGFSYAPDVGAVYGEGTALAVKKFQEKYVNDVLLPYGLARGTGYVGKTTRAKLNQLYGCSQEAAPPDPPEPQPMCSSNWQCGSWSVCLNNTQTRACSDSNSCDISTNKPTETQACSLENKGCTTDKNCQDKYKSCYYSCSDNMCVPLNTFVPLNPYPDCTPIVCAPNWQCGSWSNCFNGTQNRTCSDLNTCGVNTGKPSGTQECNTESGCSDSDSGMNVYTKGTTCVGQYCETDYCKYDATVTEFYCTVKNGIDMIGWEYMPCAGGVCSEGVCVLGGSNCKNECISGSTYCTTELYSSTGKLYLKQCGNYDDDPCSEWGTPTLCSGDTSCGYGRCYDRMKPVWFCNLNIGQGACDYNCVESSECCVPKTCSELACGVHDNGCGQTIDCGSCDAICSSLEKSCGKWNYSGTQVSCGACPSGKYCQNGQCLVSTITSCIDSEQGLSVSLQSYIAGSVINPSFLSEPVHDECVLPQNSLVDFYCKNGIVESTEFSCGGACKQGICIPGAYEINRADCKNKTSGGAGFVYGDNVYDLSNYCVDNNLVKYTCQNYSYSGLYFNWLKTEIISCENGCQNNACIGLNP